MILLWLVTACISVFSFGAVLGYLAGRNDGREERAREEWRNLRR